ncbi:MAG: SUMF1/EgtB/PvdO family nonheme iron enzyme [Desmonostoc vinosum HA7617-LM4]|jgi:formylglycine-generating enzyme required for sulfatase activity/energy-coupling factor transporter ATP-binding protein EcfA2|nr:SUMF1/EgtB/PvdO family nonheme iron enzyme [Desmonostoc vinosum HA7617-LM4]
MNRDALVVGINQYPFLKETPTSKAKHLLTPANDAEAIAQRLEEYGDFRVRRLPETIQHQQRRVMFDGLVKFDTLEDAIVQLFNPVGKNIPETALLYFIGHGLRKNRGGVTEGFLATSDVDPRKNLWGVSLRWLRELLQKSPVKQQIVWLDCCYSGELFNFTQADLGTSLQEQTRFLIAASREFEPAQEDIDGKHGVFSHALWQGLDPRRQPDGLVNNDKLIEYIAQTLKDIPQQPIWYNPNREIMLTGEREDILIHIPDEVCPYKGLRFFDVADAGYFYGREALTQKLIQSLQVGKGNFLAVLGVSGSGKSSLLRAGLMYQLQQQRRLPGTEQWKIRIFTPSEQPLVSLATVFLDEDATDIQRAEQLKIAQEAIASGATGLARLIKASRSPRALLIIDQFEEIFTICQSQIDRQQFIAILLGALKQAQEQLCIIFAMRDDFLGKCAAYHELTELIQANLVMVTPMSLEELQQAIREPAIKLGRKVEENLINTILQDLGVAVEQPTQEPEPGMLPLLSYTLEQLWQRQTLNWLKLDSYQQLGGVRKTLENLAQQTYKQLSAEEQQIADLIFINLTQLGEGTPDTRKQVPQRDLVALGKSALVEQVIQKLAQSKLIVTSEQRRGEQKVAVVDVAHEALIRHWSRLRELLDNNREAIRTERRIQAVAEEWEDKSKSVDYLLTGLRLAEAEKFLQEQFATLPLSSLSYELIQASQKERDCIAAELEQLEKQALEQERQAQKRELQREKQARRGWQWLAFVLGAIAMGTIGSLVYREGLRQIAIRQTEMVSISQGKATIGTDESNAYSNEKPQRSFELSAFQIQKFEVSNRLYRLCVQARHCDRPVNPSLFSDRKFDRYPVVEVTAFHAATYCEWLGMRLPTELEWERAARGSQGEPWPWGNKTPVANFANISGKSPKSFAVVDAYKQGRSKEGEIYNLIGNVWEWTASYDQPSYKNYDLGLVWKSSKDSIQSNRPLITRGGGWMSKIERVTLRLQTPSSFHHQDLGIRCAK